MINLNTGIRWLQGGCLAMAVMTSSYSYGADILPVPKGERLSASTPTNGAIKITGTVVLPPPCTVNNDKPIDIEFGDVRTDLIDGETYGSQPVPVSISCQSNPSSQLQLKMEGVASPLKDSVLATSVNGLGIRMLCNGNDFALNSPVNVNKGDSFVITAVPYTRDSKALEAGEFTAVATLVVIQE
jgi:type 1 fimbria pilin